jgi:hypothetical protein
MKFGPQSGKNLIAGLRIGPDIVGIPPMKVDSMAPTEAVSAAEEKRQRKMAKRALTNAKLFDKVK